MSDIFLSYAREDRERVRPLAEALGQHGWDVWWDRELLTGRIFNQSIEEQLAAARSLVVVWTSISIGREWVMEGAQHGKDRDILFPVFLDKVKAPLGFRLRQGADLSGGIDASGTAFQKLLSDLADVLDAPTPLQKVPEGQLRNLARERVGEVSVVISLVEMGKRLHEFGRTAS